MAMKYKTVGGTPNEGLPADFTNMLQGMLTGSYGGAGASSQAANADPYGSTQGIGGILQDLLSGGAGKIGGSMADMISKTQTRNVNDLRSRFGTGGGTAFGTPAAYAESMLRSEEAPKLTQAIGGLQQNALAQLLPIFAALAARGTPQAEVVGQQNPWVQGITLGTNVLGAVASAVPFSGGYHAAPTAPTPMTTSGPASFAGTPGYSIPPNYYMQNNPFGR